MRVKCSWIVLFCVVVNSIAIFPFGYTERITYSPAVYYGRDASHTPSHHHIPQKSQKLQMANYLNSRRPYPYRTPSGPGFSQHITIRPVQRPIYKNQPYVQELPFNPSQRFYLRPVSNQNNLRAIPAVVAHVESINSKPPTNNNFRPLRPPRSEKYEIEDVSTETNGDGHHPKESYKEAEEENFDKKQGSSHEDEWTKSSGEKGSKEYESNHNHKNGKKGEHFEEDESGNYSEEKGTEKEHYDESDEHGSHHEAKKGEKGGKVGEKKQHKKGSKTSGYHNVFHKDEYKKDHTFYDTADHKGNFHKYGSDHADHSNKAGHTKKGQKHDSSKDEKHNQKKGNTDKGHYDKDDSGYEKEEGHDKHHKDHEEHKKDKKSHSGDEFAFKKGDMGK